VSRGSERPTRPYQMRKRAEQIDDTRLRIVEATVALHGTVGPAGTTVMGIARQAGVTRATVYRHFPDQAALLKACTAHWLARQVPPNPGSWAAVTDPTERMQVGLSDLYRFYRSGQEMLARIYRDKPLLPDHLREDLDARDVELRDLLLAGFSAAGKVKHRLGAVLGHGVRFWTWHSLCIEEGLRDGEAIDLIIGLAAATATGGLTS
jgi:AcrR family transcriptional regulator